MPYKHSVPFLWGLFFNSRYYNLTRLILSSFNGSIHITLESCLSTIIKPSNEKIIYLGGMMFQS